MEKTIYVATNDKWPPLFDGEFTPILWANQSKLRGGNAGLDLNLDDISYLAQSAVAGNPNYPVWGGTIQIKPNTPVCLDLDWYLEQGWPADKVATYFQRFKQVAPNIPLCTYNAGDWPLADYLAAPVTNPDDILKVVKDTRENGGYNLLDPYLDIITIRSPLLKGIEGRELQLIPIVCQIAKELWPNKKVMPWIRGSHEYYGGFIPDRYVTQYCSSALINSDGVVIWGDNGDIPKILASCQRISTPRKPPAREPFII